MKRLFATIITVAVLVSSCLLVSAQESAQFSLDVDNVKSNRLFDISVSAKCSSAISGGEIELTYDSSVVEYRNVSSEYFEVKAKDYGDKLHIVFATADAVKCDDVTELISVKFKSVAQGEFDAKLNAIECIDEKLQDINTQSVLATIAVKKDTVTATSKSSSDSTPKYKSSVKKSQAVEAEDDDTKSGYSEMTVDPNFDTNKAIWDGVCAGLVVILAFALGMIFRKKADSDSKDKKNIE